jgi:hypothetical protein
VNTAETTAAVEHVKPLARTFTLLEDARPVPVTWTTHDAVMGQLLVIVRGPFKVNIPTLNEKSVFPPTGLFAQHSRYRAPEVPSVVWLVATAYTSYGDEAVTVVTDVNPVKVPTAATGEPHDCTDVRMRISFELRKPTPDNCSEHASVNVQSVAPVYGPDTWKGPTSKT